jgi:hypothetical protein
MNELPFRRSQCFHIYHVEKLTTLELGRSMDLMLWTKDSMPKIGRNEPCFCGNGKEFKKCCDGQPPFIGDLMSKLIADCFLANADQMMVVAEETARRAEEKLKNLISASSSEDLEKQTAQCEIMQPGWKLSAQT